MNRMVYEIGATAPLLFESTDAGKCAQSQVDAGFPSDLSLVEHLVKEQIGAARYVLCGAGYMELVKCVMGRSEVDNTKSNELPGSGGLQEMNGRRGAAVVADALIDHKLPAS